MLQGVLATGLVVVGIEICSTAVQQNGRHPSAVKTGTYLLFLHLGLVQQVLLMRFNLLQDAHQVCQLGLVLPGLLWLCQQQQSVSLTEMLAGPRSPRSL